ncbi:hypothetical protein IOD16_18785 [Saccharothrix sp. 6-C]|uniref:hypothetical protein n=1 Tax=Saccharothrix sp. 6-C TaxID=2781735 RepID=UPI00191706BB|nr:hypothetical protein [Saccharothrix sp. 6-C]QQQ80245.1 hypothetical protein IOD16_18785 [Saccharothrix sp. 6-C]
MAAASSREAERLGDVVVRPEHVAPGWVRAVEERGARPSGVAEPHLVADSAAEPPEVGVRRVLDRSGSPE